MLFTVSDLPNYDLYFHSVLFPLTLVVLASVGIDFFVNSVDAKWTHTAISAMTVFPLIILGHLAVAQGIIFHKKKKS